MTKDYVQIAVDYAQQAIADKKRKKFGVMIRQAAKRFLDDLKRAKKRDCKFYFDEWHANDPCDFIEKLPHVEGKWDTENIVMHPSHVFFVVQLFGFRKKESIRVQGFGDNNKFYPRRYTSALFAVARKNAKALALDTPIPTPDGWKSMGDLEIGDRVFGADGKVCNVIATSPVFDDHDCYKLTFSNAETVIADAGHLWNTIAKVDQVGGNRVGNRKTRERTRTTLEIVNSLHYGKRGDVNHSLRMPEPLQNESIDLPIDPYALGAWLGDGHTKCASITCDPLDAEILDGIRDAGWPVKFKNNNGGKANTYSISTGTRNKFDRENSFQSVLRSNGLLGNKHIPSIYLRASFDQRIALLQGLMDTDGTINKNGRVISFTTILPNLANKFSELLSTFGIKHSLREDPLVCNGRVIAGVGYKLQFMAFKDELPVFRLPRKLERMRVRGDSKPSRSKSVQIVAAEKVESVPVKCISVDSNDKLFLFGRSMLPTHNSTLASSILNYCLCCEPEDGAQIISAATTYDQAAIIFKASKAQINKTPELREYFGLEVWAKAITRFETGASYKALHSKASTQDGLNPSHVGLDEIHAHKTADLLNVLTSAAGARANPLWLYTTTEGYTNPGPWAEIRAFAKKLLAGAFNNDADHFLVVFYALDEENKSLKIKADDEFDESKWIKANPLLDVNKHLLSAIRKEAIEAKQMPSKLAEFRIKRLNRPASTAGGWIDLTKWQKCAGEVDLEFLRDHPCYGGLDLASTTDIASFRAVWKVGDMYYTWGIRWVPESAVNFRTERGTVPYSSWVESGLLKQTEGDVTDYKVIEDDVTHFCENFNVQEIAYDPWNASDLVNRLVAKEIPMIEFIQGTKSFHPAMQELERAYISGNLCHGGDPVLNWCASNIISRCDQNMNKAPDKKRSPDKIDDMVALLMPFGLMNVGEVEEDSFWNKLAEAESDGNI